MLGKPPLAKFQDLRVERAQSLLYGSGPDIDAIASEVGYADNATLRKPLRQWLAQGVRELRADLLRRLRIRRRNARCLVGDIGFGNQHHSSFCAHQARPAPPSRDCLRILRQFQKRWGEHCGLVTLSPLRAMGISARLTSTTGSPRPPFRHD
nr:hypothetical protein [Paraburkholderia bannensis]